MSHVLGIITVIYNNYTILQDFFESLNQQTNKNFKVFLVDLSDKKQSYNYPSFVKVITAENHGYSYGVNLGLKNALQDKFDKFSIINSDVFVKSDFNEQIINSLSNYPAALIGGKIYYAPGFEFHKNKYSEKDLGKVIWYAGGSNDWKNCFTIHRGVDEIDINQYDQIETTDFITGCLINFDKKVIDKIGFWDESYFLYYEDADYCERAKKNKIPLYYNPNIVIWHKNAQSTDGSGSTIHQKYQYFNQLKFGLKYAPLKTKLHLLKNFFFNSIKNR